MSNIHVNRDRQNLGQFTPEDIAEGLRSGRFLPTDLGWRDGMETWQPLSTFTDLPEPGEIAPPAFAPGSPIAADTPITGEPVEDFPWVRRHEIGFFSALWGTIAQSLGHPATGFARLTDNPKMSQPYSFYLLTALVTGALSALLMLIFVRYGVAILDASGNAADPQVAKLIEKLRSITPSQALLSLLIGVPLLPFFAAGAYHALLMMVGGANASFQKTFAVTCYVLGSASPLQLLPCCGPIIQIVWILISASIGLGVAHRTDTWRASLAVGLAFLVYCTANLGIGFLQSLASSGMLH